jgi:hypothetical protein
MKKTVSILTKLAFILCLVISVLSMIQNQQFEAYIKSYKNNAMILKEDLASLDSLTIHDLNSTTINTNMIVLSFDMTLKIKNKLILLSCNGGALNTKTKNLIGNADQNSNLYFDNLKVRNTISKKVYAIKGLTLRIK